MAPGHLRVGLNYRQDSGNAWAVLVHDSKVYAGKELKQDMPTMPHFY